MKVVVVFLFATIAIAQAVPKVTPPTQQPTGFIESISDRITILSYQKAIWGDDGKSGLEGQLKVLSDKIAQTEDGKRYLALQKELQGEATAEMGAADRIINQHHWKARFDFQTQRFEAKP